MMQKLFESFKIKNTLVKNRIFVPPMVCFNWTDADGYVTEKNIFHYGSIAQGGPGLIVQEATSPSKDGRVCDCQLGIWEDGQLDGLKKIATAVHHYGIPIVMQLNDGGYLRTEGESCGPSEYDGVIGGRLIHGRALSQEQLHAIQQEFITAGYRAFQAGYDGIELNACHNYLISQFMNCKVNRREDPYGQTPELFCIQILDGIRKMTSEDFILGIRLGIFEPALKDGIAHALKLEQHGADYLSLSSGFESESEPVSPDDYEFHERIYGAEVIKRHVSIPVFANRKIQTPTLAESILEKTKIDMVGIGKGFLVNYNWAQNAKAGRDVGKCLQCKTCMWRVEPSKCPGRKLFEKSQDTTGSLERRR